MAVINYKAVRRSLKSLRSQVGSAMVGFMPGIAGAVARTTQDKLRDFVSIKDLGVVGDGVTNDTANLQKANNVTTPTTYYFPDGDYYYDDQLVFDATRVSFNFAPGAVLHYYGTADQPTIIYGNASGSSSTNYRDIWGIQIENHTTHDYSNDDFVGVRLVNVRYSTSYLKRFFGFTNNIQLYGSSTSGISYNTFFLGWSNAAKRHLDIVTNVAEGFVNENRFFAGRCSNIGLSSSLSSYGVVFRSDGANNYSQNNNTFYGMTFELGDGDVGVERMPVDIIDNGGYNRWHDTRVESGRGPVMRVTGSGSNECAFNIFELGVIAAPNITGLEVSGAKAFSNKVINAGQELPGFTTGSLLARAWSPTSGTGRVAGFRVIDASTGVLSDSSSIIEIGRDHIQLNGGAALCYEVDTTVAKHFRITVDAADQCYGRVLVQAFDSTGTKLTSASTGYPHVISPALTYSASGYGGDRYGTTVDSTGSSVQLSVTSHVAKLRVFHSSGTNRLKLRAINLLVESLPSSLVAAGVSIAPVEWTMNALVKSVNADPTNVLGQGFVTRGEVFYNSAAASAATSYWQATSTGISAKDWVASTAYVVGQLRNNDTGKVYVCRTGGTSAGAGGPTGTSTGITDGTVVWDYTGQILPTYTAGPSNP